MIRSRWLWRLLPVTLAALVVCDLIYADLLAAAFAGSPAPRDARSVARGAALWHEDCEVCHGAQGRGDGPAVAALRKQPKDLTRIARPPIFPDGIVAYRIANGGETMPAWKSVLSEQDIWALVDFIRDQRR